MTKEQLYVKWLMTPDLISDLDAVIATEIAKAKVQPKPELNPIEQAFERGEKIRVKDWFKGSWVKKNSDNSAVDEKGNLWYFQKWSFYTKSEDWELYTEPAEQTSSQVKLDNSFDKDRFEAMFRAVVASGHNDDFDADINDAKYLIQILDAYYATKNN